MEQDTADIIKKVRKVEIKTRSISKHLFSGEYHSAFKGRGMSFSEVRSYQYGDDIRDIDWNVTAKTGDAHIKVYEEERELTVILLIDISGSGTFGSAQFKRDIITEIAAVLAFSATTNNDKVGAILFSDQIELYIPPSKGKKNILRIIRELIHYTPKSRKTDIEQALRYLTNVQKKRAITFLLSDFIATDFTKALQIAAKRHDIIGLHISDELERSIADIGLAPMRDAETGQYRIVDTSSADTRRAMAAAFEDKELQMVEAFRKSKSDLIDISTEDDYIKKLLSFFKGRGR